MSFLPEGRLAPAFFVLEAHENYQKQSWRNRCRILSDKGPVNLSIPVVHRNGSHNDICITDVEIDYSTDWVRLHKMAILSAYGTSAYFEYYSDDVFALLDEHVKSLFELNGRMLSLLLDKLMIPAEMSFTEVYAAQAENFEDMRERIHPKKEDSLLKELDIEKPYFQVFSCKYGFVPNLSVIDLLFNEGPDSILYLKKL